MATQKTILASKSVKGFTLVELIVVITILAILGTIAFVSLQGYSGSARDSKRTSDVRSLVSSLSVKQTEGVSYIPMITSVSGRRVTSPSIAGAAATAGTNYEAGTANYTTLGINSANFKDPNGQEYAVGATSLVGGAFQVVATLENDGTPKALVMGNYNNRTPASVTISPAAAIGSTTITIPSTAIGSFRKGDTIYLSGPNGTKTITSISGDGLTLTLNSATATATTTAIILGGAGAGTPESLGLVADKAAAANPVVNNGTTYLAY